MHSNIQTYRTIEERMLLKRFGFGNFLNVVLVKAHLSHRRQRATSGTYSLCNEYCSQWVGALHAVLDKISGEQRLSLCDRAM